MEQSKEQIPSSMKASEIIEKVEKAIKEDKTASPTLITAIKMMLLLVKMLIGRSKLTSKNSSLPPSSDQNKAEKEEKKEDTNKEGEAPRKPGGQKGHQGSTLEFVENPEEVKELKVDTSSLPEGKYTLIGYERRQVIDIKISRFVLEYRAQIFENEQGYQIRASFPPQVKAPVQYGNQLKANAVYLSQFQLIPYLRVQKYFKEVFGIDLSVGSIYNFNQKAFLRLEDWEKYAKEQLRKEKVAHVDETGCNINGKNHWIHTFSSQRWTLLAPHQKRGSEAMDDIGILSHFQGILCHDHWKPYFKYKQCRHSLCNAHHIRELTYAHEQEGQQWALQMKEFLLKLQKEVKSKEGVLDAERLSQVHKKYQELLETAEVECPPPTPPSKKKRGRLKRSKSRNLLERLKHYETETLLFAKEKDVPFSNNQGERDIRMTKVQQKISGCFRSFRGAEIFCRTRSFFGSLQKQGIEPMQGLSQLFGENWKKLAQNGFAFQEMT